MWPAERIDATFGKCLAICLIALLARSDIVSHNQEG
jgi:hypothetical protein